MFHKNATSLSFCISFTFYKMLVAVLDNMRPKYKAWHFVFWFNISQVSGLSVLHRRLHEVFEFYCDMVRFLKCLHGARLLRIVNSFILWHVEAGELSVHKGQSNG